MSAIKGCKVRLSVDCYKRLLGYDFTPSNTDAIPLPVAEVLTVYSTTIEPDDHPLVCMNVKIEVTKGVFRVFEKVPINDIVGIEVFIENGVSTELIFPGIVAQVQIRKG
jgi:hypothetical protein